MKPIELLLTFGVLVFLSGCGGKEEDVAAVPTPATPVVEMSATAEPSAQPATTPPPSATAAPALTPSAPASPEEDAKIEFKDLDGKTITQIQWLEDMVSGYERLRASEPESPRPPLTSLDQLVSMRIVTRLPSPPAGQKFHLDTETGKVTVVPK